MLEDEEMKWESLKLGVGLGVALPSRDKDMDNHVWYEVIWNRNKLAQKCTPTRWVVIREYSRLISIPRAAEVDMRSALPAGLGGTIWKIWHRPRHKWKTRVIVYKLYWIYLQISGHLERFGIISDQGDIERKIYFLRLVKEAFLTIQFITNYFTFKEGC